MKKYLPLLFTIISLNALAEEGNSNSLTNSTFKDKIKYIFKSPNPVFNGKSNMIALELSNGGISQNHYNLFNTNIIYSIPTRIFTNGKTSISIGGIIGNTTGNVNQVIGGVMHEFILNFDYFYITAGIGAYIRNTSNATNQYDNIGSTFTFGEKFGIGKTIDNFNVELFFRHYSNGNLTEVNKGYNFIGLQIGYVF